MKVMTEQSLLGELLRYQRRIGRNESELRVWDQAKHIYSHINHQSGLRNPLSRVKTRLHSQNSLAVSTKQTIPAAGPDPRRASFHIEPMTSGNSLTALTPMYT